jgi:hypothetical protein
LGDSLSINSQQEMPYGQLPAAGQAGLLASVPGIQIYEFRGGAGSWFGTQILGIIVTFFTVGDLLPVRRRPG